MTESAFTPEQEARLREIVRDGVRDGVAEAVARAAGPLVMRLGERVTSYGHDLDRPNRREREDRARREAEARSQAAEPGPR